jgi:UDP-N-acetylmuramyl pentapeptide phosphotransferase/UDP-N-acetylglucosamine-1-phosphate transferase
MLGDTGAHALGAVLGAAVVVGKGQAGLVAPVAVLVVAAVCGGTG